MFRFVCPLFFVLLLPAAGWAKVHVFVSVAPLKYFVERVGGEHVSVQVMVQPGHSPATYEPTPRQMAALSKADVYVRIGVPFEAFWMSKLEEINPALQIIDCRDGISSMPIPDKTVDLGNAGEIDRAHDHAAGDPHVWLDPSLVKIISRNIRDRLMRIDDSNSAAFEQNTEQFGKELDKLDREIRQLTANIKNPKFLVFHPAWGYFARAYGLEQIAVEHEGKEPGPSTLARLIETIKRLNISTVFVQRQFSTQVAATLAEQIDGKVVILDPLAEDYFANLRAAAAAISNAQPTS